MLEFESAAADILQIFAEHSDYDIVCDLCARFIELLVVDQYFPRENQSLGAFS
jgi:hypothetical protein